MKKIFSVLFAFIMLMATSVPAFASSVYPSSNSFYVSSEDVPTKVTTHLQNSIAGITNDLYDANAIKAGTPFKVYNSTYDLYYSIIYCGGEIVGTYRMFESDDHYTGIFSQNQEIINNLEEISSLTSENSPATIMAGEYDDLYALIDSNPYTIQSDPAGNVTSEQRQFVNGLNNTSKTIDASTEIPLNKSLSTRSSPSYKFLQIGWDETQGSEPWCMAYVTASIMRYKTNSSVDTISARSVMEWAYPDLSYSELCETALSTSKADDFANTYNIDPVYTASTRSYSQIVSEIKADNPVAFICDNLNTGAKKSHAFVCRGYNDNNGNSFYSIWNPWYDEFERIYTSDNTYVNAAGTAKYKWSATMYSWD